MILINQHGSWLVSTSPTIQDNDLDSNADVKADFYCDYVQSLLSSQSFDYIHASPVCSTYSVLAAGKHRNKQDYNRSLQSYEADAMLTTLYFFVANALKNNSNATVTIENPRGWMQKGNIMKELFEGELGFKRFGIHCEFIILSIPQPCTLLNVPDTKSFYSTNHHRLPVW